jgi:hypothetical protein
MWVEFQVVERCPAGYLLGVDAMAAYKISIDYPNLTITLRAFDPVIKVPIAVQTKCTTRHVDPRIFAAKAVNMRPYSEVWVPVRFSPLNQHSDLFVTPVRHTNIAEGTYATCSYAIMKNDTSHLMMINPSPRPVRIPKDHVVGMYEPFQANTPCSYHGTVSHLTVGHLIAPPVPQNGDPRGTTLPSTTTTPLTKTG